MTPADPLMLVRHTRFASQLGSEADSLGLSAIRKQSAPAITRLVLARALLQPNSGLLVIQDWVSLWKNER